jgi:outer membrane receptor for ferrienterochelin and colicin
VVLIFSLGTTIVFGDIRGKIAGRVLDAADGSTLVGVNVYIADQGLGAITAEDGYYAILNVSPGLHTISASYIGYRIQHIQGVQVISDQTTNLNFSLEVAALEGEEVTVTAEKPLVQADLTSSKTIITEQDLKILPTETFQGLLNTKAGVTVGSGGDLHVRGGRSSEILYMVDGIPVPNPFSSGLGLSLSTSMISELTLVSGTFNAEYGKAMSGVVNLVTRDGGNEYQGEARFQVGDMYSTNTHIFQDIDDIDPVNFFRSDLTLSGPLPLISNASFLITGTLRTSQGWLYGWREHNTIDFADLQNDFLLMTGDSSRVAMNPYDIRQVMAKLSFRPWQSGKLMYQFTGYNRFWQQYGGGGAANPGSAGEHAWKFNPAGRYHHERKNYLHAVHYSQTLSAKTYFTIKGAYKISDEEQYVHKLQVPYTWDENTYYHGGDIADHDLNGDGVLDEITIDWEFLREHGGFIPNPIWYSLEIPWEFGGQDTTLTIDVLQYEPNNFPGLTRTQVPDNHFYYGGQRTGYYLRDHRTYTLKFDLSSQVTRSHHLRMGLESNFYKLHYNSIAFEMSQKTFWQPYIQPISTGGHGHDEYTRYPFDFAAYVQDKVELESIILQLGFRYDYFDAQDSTFSNKINPVKDVRATPKSQISPRLGVSFPISDQGYIHFSYGHFFQMPPFSYLYRNPDLKRPAGEVERFGNPDLDAQKTVMYELGLQQQLSPTTAVDATIFYRNILNWLSSEYNYINNIFRYTRYVTQDYGNVRGMTIALTQRTNLGVSLNVDYTYEIAEGSSSRPDEAYYDNLKIPPIESEKKVVPLTWDVRHSVSATVSYVSPKGFGTSLISKYSTGVPYTPTIQGLRWAEENSGRKPVILSSDLQMFKTINIAGQEITATLKVYNLFDRLNERYVFTDTGRSTYSLAPTYKGDPAEHYPNIVGVHSLDEYLYSPNNYRSPRQILFGLGWSF